MRIENIQYLWLLLPVIIALISLRSVRFMWVLAFFLWILALARPQTGFQEPTLKSTSRDVFLVFDISRSMLVTDIQPSRIRFSTLFAEALIKQFPENRYAIFPFAGVGYLQMPLTKDPDAAKEMLSYLSPELVSHPSSRLNEALQQLIPSIQRLKSVSPAVVVFSDGELETPLTTSTLNQLRSSGITVHAVAVATLTGGKVVFDPRTLSMGHTHSHQSKLDRGVLEALTQKTGGTLFPPSIEVVHRLGKLLRTNWIGSTEFRVQLELYPYLILLGLFAYLKEFHKRGWSLWLRHRPSKHPSLIWTTPPKIRATSILSVLLFLLVPHFSMSDEITESNPRRKSALLFNRAHQLEAQEQIERASNLYQEVIELTPDPILKKQALFNLGNIAAASGDGISALGFYQLSIDTVAKNSKEVREIHQKISTNMARVALMMKNAKPQSSQGNGNSNAHSDPKKPNKDFKTQEFSAEQRRKLFELHSNEERQALQRILESRNRARAVNTSDKPW